jgi:DNA processing protein
VEFDVRDLLIISSIPGIGPTRYRSLINHFKDPSAIAHATARQLVAVEGIERKMALAIVTFFRNGGAVHTKCYVDEQLSRLNRTNARVVTLWDKTYPAYLKKIYDPPPFLFVRGEIVEHDSWSIAIVGTRNPTPYGTNMAERFSAELAALGITVVSGLARGIDTSAHLGALKAGGRTIAVIGSGVDIIYPPENTHVAERMIEQGAVVSEFEMGAKPDAGNFPRRNRIISGMTLGTLVVETGIDGGAMITATFALDQNRQVFAIPSTVDGKRKSGTNLLIKEGRAMLTESVDDIVQELGPQLTPIVKRAGFAPPAPDLSLFEQQLYDMLNDETLHIDILAQRSGMSTSDALVHLLSLEFKGIVRQLPGKLFIKC